MFKYFIQRFKHQDKQVENGFFFSQNFKNMFLNKILDLGQTLSGPPFSQGRDHEIESFSNLVIFRLIGFV